MNALMWLACFAAGTVALAAPKPDKDIMAASDGAPTDNGELGSLWKDPEFVRRMTPEEQSVYREKVVPLLREDLKKALAALEGLVKPSASAVFDFTLGNVYAQNEDLTNAIKHYETAVAKYPDFRRAHKNLGLSLVRDGKYAEAVKPLTRAIALGGGDGRVFGSLGYAYMTLGRNVSAEAAFRQALVFEPENLTLKLGLVQSSAATASHDYALALLDELIQEYPDRDSLWSLQAKIHLDKEEPAKAAMSLEMLRRLGRARPESLYLLGDLYMAQESRDLALEAYLEAINKDGGQNPSRALRAAQILASRGAWPEAKRIFARIRSASATLSTADELKLLKLESKVAMSTGAGEKAIETLEQIVRKDPLDGEALLMAGDYYARNGDKEKAELRFATAAAIQGYEADAWVKHAQLLVQAQKYPQAAELLKKAQKVKPRDNVQRYLEKVEQLARGGHS
jgi:tetratricopeptide (TPR) repeat protein